MQEKEASLQLTAESKSALDGRCADSSTASGGGYRLAPPRSVVVMEQGWTGGGGGGQLLQQSQNEQLKSRGQTDRMRHSKAQEWATKKDDERGSDRKRRQSVQVDARGGPAISNGA